MTIPSKHISRNISDDELSALVAEAHGIPITPAAVVKESLTTANARKRK